MINEIIHGDCLDVFPTLQPNSVDLIYNDPPFYTQRNFDNFKDSWKSLPHYLSWLNKRFTEMRRVMKSTASIYIHCDWHASHYIKIELDKIFDYDNFQNEIIWRYGLGGSSPKRWQRKHDAILFYTKGDKWTFNPQMVPATSQRMKGKMKKMDDVWGIPSLNNMATERTGYNTQKPEELLERIILASSNEGDVVLDPMCGSGTTCVVAKRLERKYIGIDISNEAVEVSEKRLYDTLRRTKK